MQRSQSVAASLEEFLYLVGPMIQRNISKIMRRKTTYYKKRKRKKNNKMDNCCHQRLFLTFSAFSRTKNWSSKNRRALPSFLCLLQSPYQSMSHANLSPLLPPNCRLSIDETNKNRNLPNCAYTSPKREGRQPVRVSGCHTREMDGEKEDCVRTKEGNKRKKEKRVAPDSSKKHEW